MRRNMVSTSAARGIDRRDAKGVWPLRTVACAVLGAAFLIATVEAQTAPAKKGNAPSAQPAAGQDKSQPSKPSTPAAADAPKIQVDEPKHEFGEVWSGTKIEHTFLVRNTGKSVLKIIKVKASCGCTRSPNYDREILPGAVGKIPVSINTSKLRSKINKAITVTCNDKENETVRLSVSGTVKERFGIEPRQRGSFGRIKSDDKLERTLTLTNNTDQPIKLSLPQARAGVFTAELKETTPGQVYELILRSEGPFKEKYNRATFSVATDLKDGFKIPIVISAFVAPRVEIVPSEIIIAKPQPKPRTQRVTVRFNTTETFKVLSAEVDSNDIAVNTTERKPGEYRIELDLPANYQPPLSGHKLTLKTTDPKNLEITVNIGRRRAVAKKTRERPAMKLAGKPAPPATFTTVDGGTFSTTEPQGQISLIKFYASWCGFCKRALPKIDGLYKEYKDKGVRFVAVSLDSIVEDGATGKRAKTKEYVIKQFTDLNLSLPQAFDPNKFGSSLYKVSSFPTMFLIGKTGTIERVYVGGGAVNNGSLKKDIDDLLAGKKLPAQQVQTAQKKQRPAMQLAGKPIPTAKFPISGGGELNVSEKMDEITLVKFYASWCGFCKKALPKVDDLYKEYKDKGVRIVAVNQDTLVEDGAKGRRARTKAQVLDQWKSLNLSLPVAFDPDKAGSKLFKVSSFPTMFLLGKTGKVERVYVGGGAVNNGSLKKDIDVLLAGKMLVPQKLDIAKKPERPVMKLAGKPLPAATFRSPEGKTLSTSELTGQVTLMKFYASWCGYCKKALPQINDLHKEYKDRGLRVVAISQDTLIEDGVDPKTNRRAVTKEKVTKQWKDLGIEFAQYFDPDKAGRNKFKVTAYPTMFLVGKNGVVEKVYSGIGALRDGSLKKHIDALLDGKKVSDATGATKEVIPGTKLGIASKDRG